MMQRSKTSKIEEEEEERRIRTKDETETCTVFIRDLDVEEEKGEAGVVVADELGQGPFEGVAAAD